ncbi:MAG: hypothetical protein ACR2QF_12175 [Geminicoccaceae bacterium]
MASPKFCYKISKHSVSYVHGLITYGRWTKDNPVLITIEISRFHANAEAACKIAAQGAVDALNKELKNDEQKRIQGLSADQQGG